MHIYPPLSMQREYERPFKSYPQSSTADHRPVGFYGSHQMSLPSYMQTPPVEHMTPSTNAHLMGMQMTNTPASTTLHKPTPHDNSNILTHHHSSPSLPQRAPKEPHPISIDRNEDLSSPSTSTSGNEGEQDGFKMPPKKRPQMAMPDDKDTSYWDKRRKNNESAKRSRDARRMKEEQIAMKVVYLEQENLRLRTEVSLLRSDIEKLRCMLCNTM